MAVFIGKLKEIAESTSVQLQEVHRLHNGKMTREQGTALGVSLRLITCFLVQKHSE